MAFLDPISKLFADGALENADAFIGKVREIGRTAIEVNDQLKVVEFKPKISPELRDLLGNLKALQDIEGKLAKTTYDLSNAIDQYRKMVDQANKSDLTAARIDKERSAELKNVSQAKLADAKATEIQKKAQQKKIDADLKEAESIKRKKDAQNTPITQQESYTGASDSLPIDQAQQKLNESQAESIALATEAAKATQEYSDALKGNATSQIADAEATVQNLTVSQQLSETLLVAKAELSSVNAALKENTKAYKSGAISEAEYVQKGSQLLVQQSELKTIISSANSELTRQSKATLTNAGSIEKLSVQLEILKAEYKRLTDEQRKSSYGLTLQKSIQGADAEIKRLSATIGEHQRKVGDYDGGISKSFSGAFASLRKLAYLIPGLGIAGIFNLAFEAVSKLISGVNNVTEETKKYREELKNIEESTRSQAQQDISRVNILTKLAADEEQTIRTRLRAIKELQDTYPATFGNLTKQAILEGNLGDAVNNTTKALLQRAAYQAAEKKYAAASERVYELLLKEEDATKAAGKAQLEYNKAIEDAKKGTTAYMEGLEENTGLNKATAAFGHTQQVLRNIIKDRLEAEKEQKRFLEDAQNFAAKSGDVLFGKDPKGKTPRQFDSTNAEIKGQEDLNKAIAELEKQRTETDMAANKAIYEDDKRTLDERLDAYDAYVNDLLKLQGIQQTRELASINIRLDKIKEIEGKAEKDRTNQEKSLLLDKEALLVQRQTLEEKYALSRQEILIASQKEEENIQNSAAQAAIREVQQHIQQLKNTWMQWEADQLKILNNAYNSGEISTKEYYRRQRSISKQAKEQENNALVQWLQNQKNLISKSNLPEDVKKLVEDALNTAITTAAAPQVEEKKGRSLLDYLGFGKKDLEQQKQEVARAIEDFYNTIFAAIDASRNAYYEKQFGLLDQQKQQIEDQAEAEKAAIESSLLSQQEKERKLKEIDNEKMAREKALDQQRRALQREQAVREKQDAIFQASMNAGIAISKVFAGMGTGPGAVALAIAQAALIAATTAANIAMISSRPIPEYWKGTDNHPGGPAWVGERGSELLRLPTGDTLLTPDRATLLDLPMGTEVIPHHELVRAANEAANADLRHYSGQINSGNSEMLLAAFRIEMKEFKNEIVSTILNKKETHFYWDNGELKKAIRTNGSSVKYLNKFKGKA